MADSASSAKAVAEEPFKHVIDEYVHRLQRVTCTCGWVGSSASPDGHNSDWKGHLTAVRGPDTRKH